MSYYGRRRGSPWPKVVAALVLLGAAGFVFRHQILARAEPALAQVLTVAAPSHPSIANRVLPVATPTFTVTIARPVPLANVPAPEVAASMYLAAWTSQDYARMYGLLSGSSRQSQTQAQFVRRYQDLTSEATIQSVTTR